MLVEHIDLAGYLLRARCEILPVAKYVKPEANRQLVAWYVRPGPLVAFRGQVA
jgi:hypothetical protein